MSTWESGARNTITRAELATIASALLLMGQDQDEINATDSQASICMIACWDSPQTLQQCKHNIMLECLWNHTVHLRSVGYLQNKEVVSTFLPASRADVSLMPAEDLPSCSAGSFCSLFPSAKITWLRGVCVSKSRSCPDEALMCQAD